MQVHILVVGRLKESYWKQAEAEYVKRLRPYCRLDVRELRDEAALLRAVPERTPLVALDETGDVVTSREFAARCLQGDVAFAIGGPDGHSDALRRAAAHRLAFGRMTLAHRLVRIVLIEQIYRGFSILRGTPYHRE